MNKLNQQQINQLKIGDKIEIITFHYMIGRLHTTRIIRDIFKNLDAPELDLEFFIAYRIAFSDRFIGCLPLPRTNPDDITSPFFILIFYVF